MAGKIRRGNKYYFACSKCGLAYRERIIAEKCEKWCTAHKSCNLEIIKNAIRFKE